MQVISFLRYYTQYDCILCIHRMNEKLYSTVEVQKHRMFEYIR